MSYYFSKTIETDFNVAVERVIAALKKEGFGILSKIDIRETLKNKLGVNFQPYIILGACNPPFALEALLAESRIGTMLPCNVIVRQLDRKQIEIAAVDPVASMQAIENDALGEIAIEIRNKMKKVVTNLSG